MLKTTMEVFFFFEGGILIGICLENDKIKVCTLSTLITRKLWNRKTTLYQHLRVFEVVAKQIVLEELIKSLVK